MDSSRIKTIAAHWRAREHPLELGLPARIIKRLEALRVDHARAMDARIGRLDDEYRATSHAARQASRRAS